MLTRSCGNWKTRSGTFDSLNTKYIDFESDYPNLNGNFNSNKFNVVICNNYKEINSDSLVSMFVDDYILERFWNNPLKYVNIFSKAKYVMTPDFSLLFGMPKPMQEWNVFRNRLVGYLWQKNAINIIPTVSWSDSSSFDYCFKGIKKGSIVAISNIGCRNEDHKKYFDNGLNELITKINPAKIIFQCNKKYRESYKSDIFIFLESYWDKKRKNETLC